MNWLMRAWPYDPSLGVEVPVYASLRGWRTRPDEPDAEPNIYWDRRIEVPLNVISSLFDGDQVGGRSTASVGSVKIANSDGALDRWLDLDWDGRRIELYRYLGADPAPKYLAGWTLVTRRTVEEIVPGDELELVLTTAQARFTAKARRGVFGGTGGIDGGESLKGRSQPFLLGVRRRFEPVLIDAEYNIYLVDPAGFDALLSADDGGDPFALGPDVAGYTALRALDMASLDVATAKAAGLVRLSEKPLYRLRLSARGVAPGGVWISRAADLAVHVATAFAGLTAPEIDAASVAALNSLQPADLGYWYDGTSDLTAEAVLDEIMDTVGGFWGVTAAGLFTVGRYDLPAAEPSARFTARDMLRLTPQQPARRIKTVRLSYRPGLALAEQEIAESATAAVRELAGQDREWTAPATDAATATESLLAETLDKDTLFDQLAAAEAERNRLLAVLSARRRPFDAVVPLDDVSEAVRVGQTIEIADQRYGLANGRLVVVLAATQDAQPDIPEAILTVL
ncbi:hypothetical protein [Niveispirillum cyanobacteriorum]|uniref:Uncharacterized protein n=1 Tax=Niveispirillum cyanobacteriorum TaxID=1612173 RepID=A0A2K9NDQ2_9PROT|nr:hypothetical protein [Niveispirillum cyanobacteriorum]AUN31234.1 hypothetical protein C0V82_14080 [Niveispirillum cyanobacteriorum]GGE73062.1 hypothetical protein GCM10011317_32880 [Niveispirillum cyanobacteriorum]